MVCFPEGEFKTTSKWVRSSNNLWFSSILSSFYFHVSFALRSPRMLLILSVATNSHLEMPPKLCGFEEDISLCVLKSSLLPGISSQLLATRHSPKLHCGSLRWRSTKMTHVGVIPAEHDSTLCTRLMFYCLCTRTNNWKNPYLNFVTTCNLSILKG